MTSLRFLTFTFWNYYVLKLLRLETITFREATLSDINGVLCSVLSQYHNFLELIKERLQGREMTTSIQLLLIFTFPRIRLFTAVARFLPEALRARK